MGQSLKIPEYARFESSTSGKIKRLRTREDTDSPVCINHMDTFPLVSGVEV